MVSAKQKNIPIDKQQLLKDRAEKLSKTVENKNDKVDPLEIVRFKLAQEMFAIEIKYIKEIYPLKDYTFLPCAPSFVYGLTNVRRRIVPIIDLKAFFSLPSDVKTEKKLLIMANEDIEFAILIDSFSGISSISKNDLQTTLPTLTGIREDFLKGVIIDGTVVLDGQKLLASKHLVIDVDFHNIN